MTAVEYLEEKLLPKLLSAEQYYHFEQAKVMELNQLEKFYNHGMWAIIDNGHGEEFIDYFVKTFKQK